MSGMNFCTSKFGTNCRLGFLIVVQLLSGCGDGSINNDLLIEKEFPLVKNILGKTGKIIVSHHTLNADYLGYTLENHNAYTKKTHYDYWFRNGKIDNGVFSDKSKQNDIFRYGLYWQKIAAVKQAMEIKNSNGEPRYEWVMWMDADAFFTNFEKKIEDVLKNVSPDDFLIIAKDFPTSDCVNAGVWLIKNNENGRHFIELIEKSYPFYKNNNWPEQQAIQDLIYGYVTRSDFENNTVAPYEKRDCSTSRIIKGVKVLPQRAMNSFYARYAVGVESAAWQPGDYISHFAGEPQRLILIERLLRCMKERAPALEGCEVNGSWHQ